MFASGGILSVGGKNTQPIKPNENRSEFFESVNRFGFPYGMAAGIFYSKNDHVLFMVASERCVCRAARSHFFSSGSKSPFEFCGQLEFLFVASHFFRSLFVAVIPEARSNKFD